MRFLKSLFITSSAAFAAAADELWSFMVLADWHGTETFALLQEDNATDYVYVRSREIFKDIKEKNGAELVILPGDTQTGKWYNKSFRILLEEELGYSNLTELETIAIAGDNVYKASRKLFTEVGFDKVLMAFGDHELGGNPWKVGSLKVAGLQTYRESVIKHMYKDKNGEFLFDAPIGNATSRPIGTPFASTSFAYVHKNTLLITVDAFHKVDSVFTERQRYFDRKSSSGGEGIITCTVEGDHLAWFESVLVEANKDPSIKHIFVQAHVPILQPVRRANSSGQFMDKASASNFWKVMRDHNVDIYFAGEVHANTATKDELSDLIQVVSRGNMISNFLIVDVTDNGFTISAYDEIGTEWRLNGNYTKFGELKVDKSPNAISPIESSGVLKLLEINFGPTIKFNFDERETYPLNATRIVGMKHNQYRETMIGQNITLRNETSSTGMKNSGSYGGKYDEIIRNFLFQSIFVPSKFHQTQNVTFYFVTNETIFKDQYDAQVANLGFNSVNRVYGQSAGIFANNTRVAIYNMGPLLGGEVISFSLFFKTDNSNEMVLLLYGGVFGINKKKDDLMLTLKDGNPTLYVNPRRYLEPKESFHLDDNVWHSIAISMPSKSCLRSEIEMYINGIKVETKHSGFDQHIFFTTSGKLSIGGFGYSNTFYESIYPKVSPFVGMMDSFFLWASPMDKEMLLQATLKRFESNHGTKCQHSKKKQFQKRKSANKCRQVCRRNPGCLGYELRNKNGSKFRCFIWIGERPVVMHSDNAADECNPAMK